MLTSYDILGTKPPIDDEGLTVFYMPFRRSGATTKNILRSVKPLKEYSLLFPKIYDATSKFRDWHRIGCVSALAAVFGGIDQRAADKFQSVRNLLHQIALWTNCGSPIFFIDSAFLEALDKTDIPLDYDFSTLELPFESLAFVLPHKHSLNFKGHAIDYLTLSRTRERRMPQRLARLANTYRKRHHRQKVSSETQRCDLLQEILESSSLHLRTYTTHKHLAILYALAVPKAVKHKGSTDNGN